MGARIFYVFKDESDLAVTLYSHWGQDTWQPDLAAALEHARPRWSDSSYGTRMMISHLTQNNFLHEYGFGLHAINVTQGYDLGEQTVVIDFTNKTVTDFDNGAVPVDWDNFVNAYGLISLEVQVSQCLCPRYLGNPLSPRYRQGGRWARSDIVVLLACLPLYNSI